MQRRQLRWLAAGVLAVALVGLPAGWYLLSPLFITRAVDEPLPGALAMPMDDTPTPRATTLNEAPAAATAMASTADPEMAASLDARARATDEMMAMQATAGMETAMAAPTEMVAEPMPTEMPAEPVVLAQGTFYNVVHEGHGTATIYRLPDGSRVLRLDDFEVLNGPELHVYLVPIDPVPDRVGAEIDGALDLGLLKGNLGSQNYALGPAVDLSLYRSVVIWCQPFRVPFIAAALQ